MVVALGRYLGAIIFAILLLITGAFPYFTYSFFSFNFKLIYFYIKVMGLRLRLDHITLLNGHETFI